MELQKGPRPIAEAAVSLTAHQALLGHLSKSMAHLGIPQQMTASSSQKHKPDKCSLSTWSEVKDTLDELPTKQTQHKEALGAGQAGRLKGICRNLLPPERAGCGSYMEI